MRKTEPVIVPAGLHNGPNICELPEELLVHILSYLSFYDRKLSRLVCKRWNEVSYSHSLVKDDWLVVPSVPDLKKLKFMPEHCKFLNLKISSVKNTYEETSFWLRFGFKITKVELIDSSMTNPVIVDVLKSCRNLRSFALIVSSRRNDNADSFVEFAPFSLPKLECLKLKWVHDLLDKEFKALTDNAINLSEFYLESHFFGNMSLSDGDDESNDDDEDHSDMNFSDYDDDDDDYSEHESFSDFENDNDIVMDKKLCFNEMNEGSGVTKNESCSNVDGNMMKNESCSNGVNEDDDIKKKKSCSKEKNENSGVMKNKSCSNDENDDEFEISKSSSNSVNEDDAIMKNESCSNAVNEDDITKKKSCSKEKNENSGVMKNESFSNDDKFGISKSSSNSVNEDDAITKNESCSNGVNKDGDITKKKSCSQEKNENSGVMKKQSNSISVNEDGAEAVQTKNESCSNDLNHGGDPMRNRSPNSDNEDSDPLENESCPDDENEDSYLVENESCFDNENEDSNLVENESCSGNENEDSDLNENQFFSNDDSDILENETFSNDENEDSDSKSISDYELLKISSVVDLIKRQSSCLTHLGLSRTDFPEESLIQLLSSMGKQLKCLRIKIPSAETLQRSCVQAISERCSDLESIDITLSKLGKDNFTTLFSSLPKLKKVGMFEVGTDMCNALDILSNLDFLSEIDLSCCEIKHFDVKGLGNRLMPSIRVLIMNEAWVRDEIILKISPMVPNITEWFLNYTHLGDIGLKAIVKNNKFLRSLSVIDCINLTAVIPHINKLTELRILDLSDCKGIPITSFACLNLRYLQELYLNGLAKPVYDDLKNIIKACPSLEHVYVDGFHDLKIIRPTIHYNSER